jgi:hypothetical protein
MEGHRCALCICVALCGERHDVDLDFLIMGGLAMGVCREEDKEGYRPGTLGHPVVIVEFPCAS